VQVIELDGLDAVELKVQVKWVFGAEATPELIALLKRATPYMTDFARQICGAKVWVWLVTSMTRIQYLLSLNVVPMGISSCSFFFPGRSFFDL
jgi:hypothetical protein